ncbi:Transcriptional regulator PadR-like family protein [Smaragdicoccus niigatensis]
MFGRHCGPHGAGNWAMYGPGRGAWGGPPPWAKGWGAPPWAGRRGPRVRRGDVRAAILSVLADEPRNGYQIIQEISSRSGDAWKPSPGSVYPTLQQLEDEGLVEAADDNGRKVFRLTAEGNNYVAANADEVNAPWEAFAEASTEDDGFRPLLGQTASALWQVMATGSPAQQARAREVLQDTRRRLYGILADGDDEAEES